VKKPLVTIIIATYNGELYLIEQLESLLNQSFKDYQILIADDASTDNTFNILKEYAEIYHNINIIQNEKQLGFVTNFEKLLISSETKYIAFCDQDDIWHHNKLEKAINSLENIGRDDTPLLFHSDLRVVNGEKKILFNSFFQMRGYSFSNNRSVDIMLGRSGIMGNSMVINKVLKDKVLPFPKELVVHDYWIALVNELFGQRITLDEPLLDYRIHDSNCSNSIKKITENKLLKYFFDRKLKLPYHEIKRELVIQNLLERFILEERDNVLIEKFLDYLFFKKNKIYLISILLKYNFFRVGIRYKLKLIGMILWKKK
jgi:glycosyltransferase involved in cell wall biosynthesis